MAQTDLSTFSNSNFDKGAGKIKIAVWYLVNALIVRAAWNPFMSLKIVLLKAFGAHIGKGMVIKNEVCIKSPWFFTCGDNVWLGENCWIDNLAPVTIGNNVCISQGTLIITGNHDYTQPDFAYRNAPVTIEDGAWIGARGIVAPGVCVHQHAILTIGSVATKDMVAYGIYKGNPATLTKTRNIEER